MDQPFKTVNLWFTSAVCQGEGPPEHVLIPQARFPDDTRHSAAPLPRQRPAAGSPYLEKLVVTLRRHQEAAILKLHLPVLQQVVQHWKHVSLCLLQAFQNQRPAFRGSADSTLFPRNTKAKWEHRGHGPAWWYLHWNEACSLLERLKIRTGGFYLNFIFSACLILGKWFYLFVPVYSSVKWRVRNEL